MIHSYRLAWPRGLQPSFPGWMLENELFLVVPEIPMGGWASALKPDLSSLQSPVGDSLLETILRKEPLSLRHPQTIS